MLAGHIAGHKEKEGCIAFCTDGQTLGLVVLTVRRICEQNVMGGHFPTSSDGVKVFACIVHHGKPKRVKVRAHTTKAEIRVIDL